MPDFRESVPLPVTESVLVKVAPGPALAGAYLWHRTMEASGRFDNLDEMLKEFFFPSNNVSISFCCETELIHQVPPNTEQNQINLNLVKYIALQFQEHCKS